MLSLWKYLIAKNLEAERKRWCLWLPVAFALGIGIYFLLPSELSIWWTLGVLELTLLGAWLARWRLDILKIIAIWSVILAGFVLVQIKSVWLSYMPQVTQEQRLYLTGRVVQTDTNYRGKQRIVLEDMKDYDGNEIVGRYKLTITSRGRKVKVGECVEMVAEVRPLYQTSMVGAYQLDRKAYFEGLNGTGFISSRVLPIACENVSSFGVKFDALVSLVRARIVERIADVLPADEAGIAAALVAGERGGISQKITEEYRDSGLAHFLSISGLHMSMIAGMMFFFIRLIMAFIPQLAIVYNSKKTAAVAAILMSMVYLLISGAEIPAQRAFIMTFIVLLGVLFDRKAISMRMIAWAALMVLIFSPQALVSASFQMSFAAVVALIAFYERFAGDLHHFLNGNGDKNISLLSRMVRILWAYFIGIMISDLVASVATLPFAIYHFNQIALFTTLTNLLAGPIIGFVIMPFILAALLLMPLGLDYFPLKLVGWGIGEVNKITAWVAGMENASIPVLSMPLWGLVLIVLGGLWLCIWQRKWRLLGLVPIVIGFASIALTKVPDVMVDDTGEIFGVKDENNHLVILPSRGNAYLKNVWLEKNASPHLGQQQTKLLKQIYNGKKQDKSWLDLECDKRVCVYKNRFKIIKFGGLEIDGKDVDFQTSKGANFYLDGDRVEMKTVRESFGQRLWN